MVLGGVHIIVWGGWPWQWRFYYVSRSRWGNFGELMLGPIGFTWPVEEEHRHRPDYVDYIRSRLGEGEGHSDSPK